MQIGEFRHFSHAGSVKDRCDQVTHNRVDLPKRVLFLERKRVSPPSWCDRQGSEGYTELIVGPGHPKPFNISAPVFHNTPFLSTHWLPLGPWPASDSSDGLVESGAESPQAEMSLSGWWAASFINGLWEAGPLSGRRVHVGTDRCVCWVLSWDESPYAG